MELEGREKDTKNPSAPHERIPSYNRDKIDINKRIFSLEGRVGVLELQAAQREHDTMLKKLFDADFFEKVNESQIEGGGEGHQGVKLVQVVADEYDPKIEDPRGKD